MSIQRSKSAPLSIAGPATIHVPRSYSYENVQRRAGPFQTTGIAGPSTPVVSPSSRARRGDPFSLGNFFPTSRVSDEDDDWSWLRADDAVIHEESQSIASTAPVMLGLAGDKLAADAIKSEDKLGVLSLSMSRQSLSFLPFAYRGLSRLVLFHEQQQTLSDG
jgi:hypothetical protein